MRRGGRICHEGSAGGEVLAWGSLGTCNTSVPIDAQACESFDLHFACLSPMASSDNYWNDHRLLAELATAVDRASADVSVFIMTR